jgi:hypothetical protein
MDVAPGLLETRVAAAASRPRAAPATIAFDRSHAFAPTPTGQLTPVPPMPQ